MPEPGSTQPRSVAIVTGAAGGIGREIVARLVASDVDVLAVDAQESVLDMSVRRGSDSSGSVIGFVADLLDAGQCRSAVQRAERDLGPVTIVVNAAGVMHKKPLAQHTDADWDLEMGVNARAAFMICRETVPKMAAAGHGIVVNIASIWAHRGGPDRVAYIAAKHAMIGLTRALDAEFGPIVRINSVSPGPTRTPMTAALGGDQSAWMDPTQVGDVVAFLCSPSAAGIVGTDVEVFGPGRPAGL